MKKNKIKPDIEGMLNKIQDQLVLLDRKIDILFSKASTRPVETQEAQRPVQHPRPERQYYQAVCADCNKSCEIPFKPSGNRPVYCKECFAKRKNGGTFMKPNDNRPREERAYRGHHLEKKPAAENRSLGKKKAPSPRKRKAKR